MPAVARLLKRKGGKLIALYGATSKTYDHVTRNLGGYEWLSLAVPSTLSIVTHVTCAMKPLVSSQRLSRTRTLRHADQTSLRDVTRKSENLKRSS